MNATTRTVMMTVAALTLVLAAVPANAQPAATAVTPTPSPAERVATAVSAASGSLLAYQTAAARTALEPVAATAGGNAAFALALGQVLDQEKKYPEAAEQFRKASTAAPADPLPQIMLGETLIRAKSPDASAAFTRAADLAKAAIVADAASGKAWYALGVAQQRLKQFGQAITTLQKAIELRAGDPLPVYQLGVTYAFSQKWGDAVATLSRSIEISPNLAYAYYYRALAQDKMGKKDQLVLDMEHFLALAPTAPEAERALAVVKAAKR